ncbi:MAG TPA: ABC transporter permease [Candidatus Merdenecus merdavium]|nr:ABC transporter permease [Candidatus Merdenecus merdavium]
MILGFFYTPYETEAMSASEKLLPPSFTHLMGTDNFGRDIFSRVLKGATTTLVISVSTVFIGAFMGIIFGAITGYFGGWIDEILMRFNEVIMVFPSIFLALILISILGQGTYNVIIALGIAFIPSFTRIVRGEFQSQRHQDYITSAKLQGVHTIRILIVHILPNIKRTLLTTILIGFNNAILAEASMSYLGIGVQPPDASLGRMLSESQTYMLSAPWYAAFPGLFIILLILGISLISEGVKKKGRY